MLRIYLRNLKCLRETDEVGADEPYVLVTAVNLTTTVAAGPVALPIPATEVVLYGPYEDVDKGDVRVTSGPAHSFWGTDGRPTDLMNPAGAIFIVTVLEQDDGRPTALRSIVKGIAAGSVSATLPFARATKVERLLDDVNDATNTPSGGPNFDDRLGSAELIFTAAELQRARQGKPTSKRLWISGDGGRYELDFEAVAEGGVELAPAGNASLTGGLAAVSRKPENLNVWWIGADGSVEEARWREKGEWRREDPLAAAGAADLESGIAAVSRSPGTMEVWWVGPRGSVEAAVWFDGAPWAYYPLAPGGGQAVASGGIAAVSRHPRNMEVWWVGLGGSIERKSWGEKTSWQSVQVAAPGSASETGAIAAASRRPDTSDVWWIGPDGSVQGESRYDNGPEERYEIAPGRTAAATGGIGGVSRKEDAVEVWWIGADRSVQGAYRYGDDNKNWKRYQVADPASAAPAGSIAASSRKAGTMEFWFSGAGGSVEDSFWYDGQPWGESRLAPDGIAAERARMAAATRVPGTWEMWFVASDGSVQDRYWYEH